MTQLHQLTPMLKQLRLSGILETLEVRSRQADGRAVEATAISGAASCMMRWNVAPRNSWPCVFVRPATQ